MKEFLSTHHIDFQNIDLTEQPEKDAELKQITGSRIVPGIIIKQSSLLGLIKKEKHFIGFEMNKEAIEKLVLSR